MRRPSWSNGAGDRSLGSRDIGLEFDAVPVLDRIIAQVMSGQPIVP